MVATAGSEIVFWNEFSVRFNFIAVDYLIYTNEVLGNIWESYNMPLILSVVLLLVLLLLFLLRGKILASREVSMRFLKRSVFFLLFLLAPTAIYFSDSRIDILSASHTAQGGVKYTDYAIHKFLSDVAKRPRFDNTFFVIVSDHCSRSAGETDLPVNRYRIPCFIYSTKLIKPLIEQRLTSQIDLAPTLLGLLNVNYTSRFMGFDIYKTAVERGQVFTSTYQNLGYLRNGQLVILSPQKKKASFQPNFVTGAAIQIPDTDSITNEAIAWYQGASYLFKNGKYKIER